MNAINRDLCVVALAAVLTAGAIGVADAAPIVTNGDFSQISTSTGVNPGTPSQLNYPFGPRFGSFGEFVTGWTTTGPLYSQNVVWVPNAAAASGTNAVDVDTIFPFGPRPLFPASVTAPPDGGAFMAMQSNMPDSGIQQTIGGLTTGQAYTVSFDWAATMDPLDTYDGETSRLTAAIDGASLVTPQQAVSGNGGFFGIGAAVTFNGWLHESFTFVANNSSSVLSFIADGTPSGLPPYALLSGVSIDAVAVPEPPELALFGGGLLGLGLWTVFVRRRQRRGDGRDAA